MNRKSMLWIMLLGCIVPVAAVFILPVFNVKLGNNLWWIFILLCPLAHIFMMGGMHDHGTNHMVHNDEQDGFRLIDGNKRKKLLQSLKKRIVEMKR
jgi:hypothetical protein